MGGCEPLEVVSAHILFATASCRGGWAMCSAGRLREKREGMDLVTSWPVIASAAVLCCPSGGLTGVHRAWISILVESQRCPGEDLRVTRRS